jgi:uncharacterized phage protein gp47/JayE
MPIYGVTDTGFVRPTMDDIRAQVESKYRLKFGASIDTDPSTPDGQMINIFAEREDLVWQLAETVYGMMDPDKATGIALDSLSLITGTFREPASFSTALLTLTGDPSTVVLSGSQAKTTSTGLIFATLENGSLVALTAWAPTTAYVVADRRSNDGGAWVCITSGTSAGSGGPQVEAVDLTDVTDGTVHWRFMGTGTAVDDVLASTIETGPKVAVSGDINLIETQVAGWNGVINLLDATPGADKTSDQGLRLLREFELANGGNSPVPAIRRAVSRVDDVTTVTVFYNNGDITDVDGLPPHSVEVVVQGGDDTEIATALFNSVAGGIGYYGTQTVIHTDTEGNTHTIKFSRLDEIEIYVRLTAEVDPATFPIDGVDQMKAAIVAFGDEQKAGKNAVLSSVASAAFAETEETPDGIGVIDVDHDTAYIYTDVIGAPVAWAPTTGYVATVGARSVVTNGGRAYICITGGTSAGSGGPSGKTTDIIDGTVHWRYLGAAVTIGLRELATFDTSRITISTFNGTP